MIMCYRALPKKSTQGIWSQLFRYLSVGAVLQKFDGDGLPELLTRFAQPKRSPTHHNRAMFQKIDVEKMRARKEKVIQTLTGGLAQLAKKRKVRVIQADGTFVNSDSLRLTSLPSLGARRRV